MIWVNRIADLDYYNTTPGAPCYCEFLVYPGDLVLQAQYPTPAFGEAIIISVLSPDGLQVYESNANAYFEVYYFTIGSIRYCNIRLKTYSPAMCSNKCWILHVQIENGTKIISFDKYTNKYCQASCCDIPRGVSLTPSGVVGQELIKPSIPVLPITECGKPLIRITANFDCYDNQLGDYYGIPSGQTWGFSKTTNIAGLYRRRPREITRNISYNCRLQRSESFAPYRLYSQYAEGTFPAWKMNELEAMFHGLWVDVTNFVTAHRFQFDGGVIAKPIGEAVCWDMFQLDTTLRTCFIRQTFGCDKDCATGSQSLAFLIPLGYNGGNFYTENRQAVGDYDALLDWFRAQNGVTSVEDSGDYDNVYGAFVVTGTGYIPTQLYYNNINPRNRVFGVPNPVSPSVGCAQPQIGEIIVVPYACATPVIGSIDILSVDTVIAAINSTEDWTVDPVNSDVTMSPTYGRMRIKSRTTGITSSDESPAQWIDVTVAESGDHFNVYNPSQRAKVVVFGSQAYGSSEFTQDDGSTLVIMDDLEFVEGDEVTVGINTGASTVYLNGAHIGIISIPGRPIAPQQVIGDGYLINIDTNGNIFYYGEPTTATDTYVEVELTDIYYNLA